MNPEVKALWVGALRSGEYGQTDGQLRRTYQLGEGEIPAEYCCLGVLCDLYDKANKTSSWDDETDNFMGKGAFPPKEVAEWAGMSAHERDGLFKNDSEYNDVVSMNDTKSTFSEIADVIERLG